MGGSANGSAFSSLRIKRFRFVLMMNLLHLRQNHTGGHTK
ncbi:hypothetical protein U719_01125 [Exiguobacterium sp. MH3]|nr:hypothetical protein U719_01125 [Exiguobacterium sp. MH3]